MITLSIDLTRIDKTLIRDVVKKDGTTAKYLGLVLWENKEGRDIYGNDGAVKQSATKEQREKGLGKQILGNFKVKAPEVTKEWSEYREQSKPKDESPNALDGYKDGYDPDLGF